MRLRAPAAVLTGRIEFSPTSFHQALVNVDIVTCHSVRRETSLKHFPATQSTKLANPVNPFYCVIQISSRDETRYTVFHHLGNGAALIAMTGVPHAIDSIITSPNGSGQSIGKAMHRRSPEIRLCPYR